MYNCYYLWAIYKLQAEQGASNHFLGGRDFRVAIAKDYENSFYMRWPISMCEVVIASSRGQDRHFLVTKISIGTNGFYNGSWFHTTTPSETLIEYCNLKWCSKVGWSLKKEDVGITSNNEEHEGRNWSYYNH